MTNPILTLLILAIVISILGSILIVAFVWKQKKKRENQVELHICTEAKEDKSQKSFLIWIFLILFGLIFVCIGVGWIIYLQNRTQGWEEIPAVISYTDKVRYNHKKTSLTVHVDYEYKGKEYRNRNLGYKSTDMYKGQNITILVNPENLDEFELNLQTQNRLFYLFIGVGGIFILFSLYQCFREATGRTIRQQAAKDSGQAVPEIEENFIKRNMFPILFTAGFFFICLHSFFFSCVCVFYLLVYWWNYIC